MKRFLRRAFAFCAVWIVTGAGALVAGVADAQATSYPPGCGLPCYAAPYTATFTIGSGGNYSSLSQALAAIDNWVLPVGSNVTLNVLDGVTAEPSYDLVSTSFGREITVQSLDSYSFTGSSVVSSSGSAGAWTYVLQLNSVTNIAVGDYLAIEGPSGGANPTYIAGLWPVTAVNAGSNQVTITTTGRQSAAASGSVAATVVDNKGTLYFAGTDGVRIWNGGTAINLGNLNIVGNDTAGTVGVSLQDGGGRVNAFGTLGVYGFGQFNILSLYNTELNASAYVIASGGGGAGVLAENEGTIDVPHLISTGNAGNNIQADAGAVITYDTDAITSGSGANGAYVRGAGVLETLSGASLTSTGNVGSGVLSSTGGVFSLGSYTGANNGASDQLQFYYPNGTLTGCNSTVGYTSPVSGYCLAVNGATRINGTLLLLSVAIGATNSCSSYGSDMRATAYDSTTAFSASTFGAQATGGGSYHVPVYCDGSVWRYGG